MNQFSDSEQWLREVRIAIKARRASRFSSLRPVGANRHPEQFSSWGANPLGQYRPLFWGDTWYAADMGDSSITWVKSGTATGNVGISRELGASLRLRHDPSVFQSQKSFHPMLHSFIKAYCLLSNGPQFVHVELFNRDEILGTVSAISVKV
jgi:hypothetical protein